MKQIILLLIVQVFGLYSLAQGNWIWEWGTAGNLGPLNSGIGVFSPANNPSSRYAAVCWKGTNGKFWRYGGDSFGDMWQYDPTISEWALMHGASTFSPPTVYGVQGVPAIANTPGEDTFGHPAWADSQGNLWMYSVGSTDDLWKYNTSTNMWTFMRGTQGGGAIAVYGTQGVPGPSVSPGMANETDCKWVDSNDNLWLFNEFNGVLWKYDPTINQWAWIKGTASSPPVYGTLGVAASANQPGFFSSCPAVGALYCMWQDSNDDLWMLINRDGATLDAEIWKYSIATNNWACMRRDISSFGASQVNYGTQCVESASAFPIPRTELRARWVDGCDNLWIYGGIGFCNQGSQMGDLWRYSPVTNNWTWIKGTTAGPVFGAQGIGNALNQPPPSVGQQHWTNEQGFWLQGGSNFNLAETHHLWRYVADSVTANYTYSNNACLDYSFTSQGTSGCNSIKSYEWNFNDPASGSSNTDSIANPSHIFSGSGTYNVTLIVTNCTWDTDTTQQTVIINCGLNVTLNSDTICVGSCTNMNANPTGGAPPYSFQWDNGITNTGTGPISVCPITSTDFTVIVTDALGDQDTVTNTITVIPQPTVNLGNDTTLCGASSVLLDAQNTGANYLWSTGATSQTITVNSTNSYWVEVDNGYCVGSDTINVTINNHQVDLGPDMTTCLTNVLLDAQNTGATYLWQDNSTSQTFNANSVGTYWVDVTVNGCTIRDSVILSQGSISVNLGNDTLLCSGSSLLLNAQNIGATFYLWSTSEVSQTITATSSGVYSVLVTEGICSAVDTIVISYHSPVASFSYADTIGCEPLLTIFIDSSTIQNGTITSWNWDFGDGSTSSSQSPVHQYSQTGNYLITLTVSSQDGCTDAVSSQLQTTVFPKPDAQFSLTPNPAELGEDILFNDQSINASTWYWTFGDGTSSTQQNPTHAYNTQNTFIISLVVTNSTCIDSIDATLTVQEDITLYVPNSFSPDGDEYNNVFSPIVDGADPSNYDLLIFNRWGELIFESHDYSIGWDGTYNGVLAQDGIYLWKIRLKNKYNDNRNEFVGHVNLLR